MPLIFVRPFRRSIVLGSSRPGSKDLRLRQRVPPRSRAFGDARQLPSTGTRSPAPACNHPFPHALVRGAHPECKHWSPRNNDRGSPGLRSSERSPALGPCTWRERVRHAVFAFARSDMPFGSASCGRMPSALMPDPSMRCRHACAITPPRTARWWRRGGDHPSACSRRAFRPIVADARA
jgi:hypothetical protein